MPVQDMHGRPLNADRLFMNDEFTRSAMPAAYESAHVFSSWSSKVAYIWLQPVVDCELLHSQVAAKIVCWYKIL